MLDQNTDRMWFVIGAVIVGAAIIFIANGTIPEIFASVTGSFEESANKGLVVVSDIDANIYGISATDQEIYEKYHGINLAYDTDTTVTSQVERMQGYYDVNMDAMQELIGLELTAAFEIKSPDGSGGYARGLLTGNEGGIGSSRSTSYPLTDEWTRHEYTFTLRSSAYQLMAQRTGGGRAGVKSNQHVTGNNGERYPNMVRNFKIEAGTQSTPYSSSTR